MTSLVQLVQAIQKANLKPSFEMKTQMRVTQTLKKRKIKKKRRRMIIKKKESLEHKK